MGKKMSAASHCNAFKGLYSTCLLIFSIVLVMGLIFTNQTGLSQDAHPAAAFIVLWVTLIWLSMVEGGQASLVGLHPVDKELYVDTHPLTYKNCSITNKGDNLDRYLMGRQFMVIFIVFCINYSGAPVPGAELWNLPTWVTTIFLNTGIAMILLTCMVGQLASQVNASHCMLDYINNYFALFTLYVAMAVEFTGVMHCSYLIAMIIGCLAGKPIESREPPKTGFWLAFFWLRVLWSIGVLGFALAVTLSALFQGKTTMWPGVPGGVAVVLFFVLMSVVGMLEGMQIAFFAVTKIKKEDRGDKKFAKMTCELLFKGKGRNLPGFMIGRQLSVVTCFFVIARVTTLSIAEGEGNLWGVPDALQNFFNTGFLGAIITTILGSITWQLVASAFPIAFLSNPITYIFLVICLAFEWTGICGGAWVLAWIMKKMIGFQRDEVYIGTAEEREAQGHKDDADDLQAGTGHMIKLPGFYEDAPDSLKELMTTDPDVAKWMQESSASLQAPAEDADVEAQE
mmetsp:Transcript_7558/g.15190  ORF Transcript_7558/g.15190 Transcript_7558/m.15190 type:complete len:511 (+) Transcript_7558:164-1696(+)